ncbi:unnamed protein product [Closterium sp. NIES-54]
MNRKKFRQIDVANSFLYAPIDGEIFVELPHGSNAGPNQVCQLEKSLYGIKQAPRLWLQHLHARLIRIGFLQLPHDQGMYRLTKGTDYILLIVYVDDLLYVGSTDAITTWFEGELQQDVTLTVATTVTQYLGLNIQDGDNAIYLSAEKYADTIAKRFGLTPTVISMPYRYTDANRKVSALLKPAGIRNYQRKLGCLLFAAVTCLPDLSYSASQLATYLKKREAEHMLELNRALHYLASTPTIGLTYHKTRTTTPKLIGYVDVDHAGDSNNRRSRTGYVYRLEPIGPISWQSNMQELIALSSAEAEYIALCSATKEGLYLRELLEEAKLVQLPSFSLFCDNQSAICIANKNGCLRPTRGVQVHLSDVSSETPSLAPHHSSPRDGGELRPFCPSSSETVLWHHRLGHPSVQRLRGMHSRYLVSGLPKVLPPLPPSPAPPCLPCVEGRQRAAPHYSSFPPTEAPLQTLHLDMWGPARVRGQGHERYFLLVVDDYTRYTTVFPLRTKGEVPDVLIPWIRTARLQLRERFQSDFPVLRLHSERGGEFSSDLLAA